MRRKDNHQGGSAPQEAARGHLNAAYYFRFNFEMCGLSDAEQKTLPPAMWQEA
jgi:hypothetical protein